MDVAVDGQTYGAQLHDHCLSQSLGVSCPSVLRQGKGHPHLTQFIGQNPRHRPAIPILHTEVRQVTDTSSDGVESVYVPSVKQVAAHELSMGLIQR